MFELFLASGVGLWPLMCTLGVAVVAADTGLPAGLPFRLQLPHSVTVSGLSVCLLALFRFP
jgi:hypothetical protein